MNEQGYNICHTITGVDTPHTSSAALPMRKMIARHIHQNSASLIPVNAQNRFVCLSRVFILSLYFLSPSDAFLSIFSYKDFISLSMSSFIFVTAADMLALTISLLVFNPFSFCSCLLCSSFISFSSSSLFCRIKLFVKSSNLL